MTDHSWLDMPVTTCAYAWRLERADGVALGFVSHDRDVVIDHFVYRATPGMVPSTLALTDSLDIDSLDISGVLANAAITETDLQAGRWNGARLTLSLINWADPGADSLLLISGEFGEIVQTGDRFRVEVLGPTSFLDAAIAPITSPTCRARFGDRACKVNMKAHQSEFGVAQVAGSHFDFHEMQGRAAEFTDGALRWLSGANCGLTFAIMRGEGDRIWLSEVPPLQVKIGDRAELTAGCDKTFATCRDRFHNALNFRGEPHLPGNDLLTRYPGA